MKFSEMPHESLTDSFGILTMMLECGGVWFLIWYKGCRWSGEAAVGFLDIFVVYERRMKGWGKVYYASMKDGYDKAF